MLILCRLCLAAGFPCFYCCRYFLGNICWQDFGIKYNCEKGEPAPEKLTNLIFENTKSIAKYASCDSFPEVDVSQLGATVVKAGDGSRQVTVEVVRFLFTYVLIRTSIAWANLVSVECVVLY